MNDAPVYLDYGQEALDAQYNNRARVPEHQDIHAAFQARAGAVVEEFETRLDVSYGPGAEETLDVYLPEHAAETAAETAPENAQGAPINVFLHGGYWFSRHKNDFRFLAQGLTRAGAVLVVVNYALVPSVDLDELVRQCRAAVAWTYGNADTFGGDHERIFVSGHSAGGQLTAMMMATDWPAFANDLPADLIKGGCAISGIYDLEPIRLGFMQETLGFTAEQVARNSPIGLAPATGAPLIVVVGGDESEEFLRQGETFAGHWARQGVPCEMMVRPGINHFTILGEFADPESGLTKAVRTQMGLG
ncbi:MAG: alpha/beta hydrolase [Proteobacteria bacterium]|nr:alpha/beta hydrolase [Pseudomonadota bacterium]